MPPEFKILRVAFFIALVLWIHGRYLRSHFSLSNTHRNIRKKDLGIDLRDQFYVKSALQVLGALLLSIIIYSYYLMPKGDELDQFIRICRFVLSGAGLTVLVELSRWEIKIFSKLRKLELPQNYIEYWRYNSSCFYCVVWAAYMYCVGIFLR